MNDTHEEALNMLDAQHQAELEQLAEELANYEMLEEAHKQAYEDYKQEHAICEWLANQSD